MITVIVPAYNIAPYIGDCLDSILAQTLTDWVALVVNDGSTDQTPEVVQSYVDRDSRIRMVTQPNAGLSAARNTGLSLVASEYVYMLDGDDMMHPQALQLLLGGIEAYNADIAVAEFKAGPSPHFKYIENCAFAEYTPIQAVEQTLYQSLFTPSAWGRLYHTALWKGLRYTEGILYEDLDIFYRLCLSSKRIVHTPAPLYFYRMRPGSIINSWNARRTDVLDVTENIERYMAEHCPQLLPAARSRRLSANFDMYLQCSRHGHAAAAQCWQLICRYRREAILNRRVRLKNKLGAMLSYLGQKAVRTAGIFYRK